MEDVKRLATLAVQIDRTRALLRDLEMLRDDAISELHAAGIRPSVLIEASGLSRPAFYRSLHAPRPEEVEDADEAFETFEEEFSERWEEALAAWQQSDHDGDPADFFPLGGLVDARP